MAKYKSKLDELKIGLEDVWRAQNEAVAIVRKNDVDSLLDQLKEVDPSIQQNEAMSLIGRVNANIPVDSPRRAEVFKSLKEAALKNRLAIPFAAPCLRSTMRYASEQDCAELFAMLDEFTSDLRLAELIVARLVELNPPNMTEKFAENLRSDDNITVAVGQSALRRIGAPAEKTVQAYADRAQKGSTERIRMYAITLLGEIGTPGSIPLLLRIKKENGARSQIIDNSIKQIGNRKKLPPTP